MHDEDSWKIWKFTTSCLCVRVLCVCVCYNAGLTDDILHSVLRRGGRSLTSLDLSHYPRCITDFGINLIGELWTVDLLFHGYSSILFGATNVYV